jgi:hypothetical protein
MFVSIHIHIAVSLHNVKIYLNIYRQKVSQRVGTVMCRVFSTCIFMTLELHILSFRNLQFINHNDIGLCTYKRTHIHGVRVTYRISFRDLHFANHGEIGLCTEKRTV